MDDIQDFEDPTTLDDPAAVALDRTLTARAFRSLPERWQSVLWYTEVEGMDPHEVAPVMGMSANGVAALSYRAREGLRKAWLQAHVSEPGTSEACKWTMSRLGEAARHSLTAREQEKINAHLETCTKCAIISEEVEEVGSHLAMVMLPIVLGGVVGGVLLSTLGHAATASAAAASAAIPAVPASFAVLAPAAVAPAVATGISMGAATGVSALVGSIAVVAALSGGVAASSLPGTTGANGAESHSATSTSAPVSASANASASADSGSGSGSGSGGIAGNTAGILSILGNNPTTSVTDPGSIAGVVNGVVGGVGTTVDGVVGGVSDTVDGVTNAVGSTVTKVVKGVDKGVVKPVTGAVTPGASPSGQAAPGGAPVTTVVSLGGKGTPGAVVAAQAAGVVYGTAKVASDGTWSLQIDALPTSVDALQLKQTLTVLGISVPLNIPLKLTLGGSGISISLLN